MDRQQTVTIRVKAFLYRPGVFEPEVRRFPLTRTPEDSRSLFSLLTGMVTTTFPDLSGRDKDFKMTWKDSDDDFVVMTTDEELSEAISEVKQGQLNVYITLDSSIQSSEPFIVLDTEGFNEDEMEATPEPADHTGGHQKDSSTPADITDKNSKDVNENVRENSNTQFESSCPPGPSYHRPPPPPPGAHVGWNFMFGGPVPWFHGRRHGCGSKYEGAVGPMRHRGFHGRRGCHPEGFPGCPEFSGFPGAPPFMDGFFHSHSASGPWMSGYKGQGSCRRRRPNPCAPCGPEEDIPAGTWEQSTDKPGRCGRFRGLIKQVPQEHRRWAKSFIRNWYQTKASRGEANNGATNTNVANDETLNPEKAGVTADYVTWLEAVLKKITDAGDDQVIDEADIIDEKNKVPVTFQRWCMWFLRCRSKSGVAFKVKFNGVDIGGCMGLSSDGGCHKKAWKKEWKHFRKNIKAAVPLKYRVWARGYIHQWRHDHVTDPSRFPIIISSTSSSSSSNDSDGPEKTLSDVVDIPIDFQKWMDKFLQHWHTARGIKLQNLPAGSASVPEDTLEETVPVEFRKWVCCLLKRSARKTGKMHGLHRAHHKGHYHGQYHGYQNLDKENPHIKLQKKIQKKAMRAAYKHWKVAAHHGLPSDSSDSSSSSSSSDSSDEEHVEHEMTSSMEHLHLNQPEAHVTPEGASPKTQRKVNKMHAKVQRMQMKMARKAAKKEAKSAWKAYRYQY